MTYVYVDIHYFTCHGLQANSFNDERSVDGGVRPAVLMQPEIWRDESRGRWIQQDFCHFLQIGIYVRTVNARIREGLKVIFCLVVSLKK